jgi:hypothetical protein
MVVWARNCLDLLLVQMPGRVVLLDNVKEAVPPRHRLRIDQEIVFVCE